MVAGDVFQLGVLAQEVYSIIDNLWAVNNQDWIERFRYVKAALMLNVLEKRKDGAEGISVHHVKVVARDGKGKKKLLFVFRDINRDGDELKIFAPYKQLSELAGGDYKLFRLMKPFDRDGYAHLPEGVANIHRQNHRQRKKWR